MKQAREKPVKTKAVIYTRVSSQRQVDNMSLSEQQRICKEYCYKHHYDVSDERIFEERGESARSANRTELQRMLQFCTKNRKEIGFVVVYKLDRFSRRVEDHAALRLTLKKLDITLLSASEAIGDGSIIGELTENVLASFAQFDNDVRGERSRNGMRAAAMEGGWTSHAPTGYVNAKTALKQPSLNVREELRKPIVRLFKEFATGRYTQEEAVLLAQKLGVRTNKGNVVSRNGVIKMLKAVVYMGYVKSAATDGLLVKGLHEPIISADVFQEVQDVLSGRKRKSGTGKVYRIKNKLYPLRRFLICSLCEGGLTASASTGKMKKPYAAYHCPRCTIKKDGARVSIPQQKAHELFEAQLSSAEPQSWVPDVFREIVLRRWNNDFRAAQKALRSVDNQLYELKSRKSRLTELYIDGKISDEAYTEKENEYTIERARLEAERDELKVKEENKERVVDNAARFLINLPVVWRELSLENKQKFQNALFLTNITVHPDQTFGTLSFSPIIEQLTDIEKYYETKIIDLPERKSIMAEEGRFELPLQISPY